VRLTHRRCAAPHPRIVGAVLLLVALTALAGCSDTQVATADVPVPKGYELAWHDEFNGDELGDGWDAEHSTFGSGNDELQCYTPDNLEVAEGTLRLTAIEEDTRCPQGKQRPYSSGLVRSEGAWTFGRFEVRARVPKGAGMLPAVWMLSRNRPFGDEGRSGELDLMEVDTDDVGAVLASMHWTHEGCGPGCSKQSTVHELSQGDATEFHTYRLDWAPEEITFRVDGDAVLRLGSGDQLSWSSAAERPSPQSATFPAPFSPPNEMYLLMNLAVGGNFVGEPPDSTRFPATMEVDYVRVYQRR
jgi:beta-glucanase (GH16 family)